MPSLFIAQNGHEIEIGRALLALAPQAVIHPAGDVTMLYTPNVDDVGNYLVWRLANLSNAVTVAIIGAMANTPIPTADVQILGQKGAYTLGNGNPATLV